MTATQTRLAVIGGAILLSFIWLAPTFMKDKLPEWWPARPIRLGLDLKGGSYLVLSVRTEEAVRSQLEGAASSARAELKRVIRRTRVHERQVQFVLFNERGVPEVEKYISENYPELRKVGTGSEGSRTVVTYEIIPLQAQEIEKNAVVQAIETIRNRVDSYGVAEPVIQRAGEKRVMVQLPDITDLKIVKETIGKTARLDFRLLAGTDTPLDETVEMRSKEGGRLRVSDQVLMSGDAIEKATVELDPNTAEVAVSLKLNSYGRRTFAAITQENVGRNLAIVLDGVIQSSPRINEPILGGTAQISGGFTQEEARQLAVVLRSGALPATLDFEEERTVGASLGQDSIEKGVQALALGCVSVFLFTLVYYKRSGILAIFALILNVLFLTALLSLLGATLTLPGIAGLVLTVGMAIDANIIIYERIKEELQTGASVRASIEAGFDKAHWTILDSNLTTLLSGIILYALGTGPIKGFAVTLCLGILTTMFCGLYVSKTGFMVTNLKRSDGSLSI